MQYSSRTFICHWLDPCLWHWLDIQPSIIQMVWRNVSHFLTWIFYSRLETWDKLSATILPTSHPSTEKGIFQPWTGASILGKCKTILTEPLDEGCPWNPTITRVGAWQIFSTARSTRISPVLFYCIFQHIRCPWTLGQSECQLRIFGQGSLEGKI